MTVLTTHRTGTVYTIMFDTVKMQMRKCGGYPMWSILLYTEETWKNVCFVATSYPPLMWMNHFIGTGVTTVQSFRDILFNKHQG